MKEKMCITKTCSFYASDLHFTTIIFPFIHRELKRSTVIHTFFERNEQKNIEKIIKNIGFKEEEKEQIRKIDWKNSNIKKIREIFKKLEEEIMRNHKIDMIICGKNIFIEKVNKAIDLWTRNHKDILEKTHAEINVINCFSLEENYSVEDIIDSHEYILKTKGVEEIIKAESQLLKAN